MVPTTLGLGGGAAPPTAPVLKGGAIAVSGRRGSLFAVNLLLDKVARAR